MTASNFDFARALGKTGADALNNDIERLAQSGRVHSVLIDTAAAHGLIMPASKKSFSTFSAEIISKDKAKGLPIAIGRAIAHSCIAIREIMGLPSCVAASWINPEPKAIKAKAPSAPKIDAVITAIQSGVYSVDDLTTLQNAIKTIAKAKDKATI